MLLSCDENALIFVVLEFARAIVGGRLRMSGSVMLRVVVISAQTPLSRPIPLGEHVDLVPRHHYREVSVLSGFG